MEDQTETGRKLRILTVEDEFTRMCLAIEVEHRMNARFVADTLMGLIAEHGAPKFIRSDNGPEFIAKYLMRLFAIHGVEARHIDPGSPWLALHCTIPHLTLTPKWIQAPPPDAATV